MTASVATYLQYKNMHMIFVNGNNIRIVVMACPNSSHFIYTFTNMPTNALQLHIITVIMYTPQIVEGFFIFNGIPAILKRNIIEQKRNYDSSFIFGSYVRFSLSLVSVETCKVNKDESE